MWMTASRSGFDTVVVGCIFSAIKDNTTRPGEGWLPCRGWLSVVWSVHIKIPCIQSYNQDHHHLISTAAHTLLRPIQNWHLTPQSPTLHSPRYTNLVTPSFPPMIPLLNVSLLTSTPTSNPLLNPSPLMSRITTVFLTWSDPYPPLSHLTPS